MRTSDHEYHFDRFGGHRSQSPSDVLKYDQVTFQEYRKRFGVKSQKPLAKYFLGHTASHTVPKPKFRQVGHDHKGLPNRSKWYSIRYSKADSTSYYLNNGVGELIDTLMMNIVFTSKNT